LHINLRKCILDSIALIDQIVVNADHINDQPDDNSEEYQK